MSKSLGAIVCALVVFSTNLALAESIEETADSIESAIDELQSALDNLEAYRELVERNPTAALRAVRNAQREMRSTAISLLLSSVDPQRPKEMQRTMDALRILEPKLFDKSKPSGRKP